MELADAFYVRPQSGRLSLGVVHVRRLRQGVRPLDYLSGFSRSCPGAHRPERCADLFVGEQVKLRKQRAIQVEPGDLVCVLLHPGYKTLHDWGVWGRHIEQLIGPTIIS